ncbi:MAG: rhodanese-like domain-containing protein [Dehalococcoidia bacterium]|nr:rhodanese-like domain-containing protein [Dehalococcoidia bacterium]
MNRKFWFVILPVLALLLVGAVSLVRGPENLVGDGLSQIPTPQGGYTSIKSDELAQMLKSKNFYFVNVHIPYAGEIEGTDAKIPYNEIKKNIGKFPPDKGARIVVYCMSGSMSRTAAQILVSLGYTNVLDLTGGMIAWERDGYKLLSK